MNVFFQNIRVINPAQQLDEVVNLWVKDGRIAHLSPDDAATDSDTKMIPGENLVCAPGFFDMHVHFREPGEEYKEDIRSGSESAANGGFTGVLCMPNTDPAIDDIIKVEYVKNKAKGLLVDVHTSAALTKGRGGEFLTPMMELSDAGVPLFTDDGSAVMNSEIMRRIFDYAASKDLLVAQHCEDHNLTNNFSMNESFLSDKLGLKGYPTVAEDIIVSRDILLAEYSGNRRYHIAHISSAGAIELVKNAKQKGLRVTTEATPHHFCLTEELIVGYEPDLKMNPPLRENKDVQAVLEALADGTIDCIATDHAPHALHEKDVEYENAPYGVVGLETALGLAMTFLVHKNVLSMDQLIEKMSINPRRILGFDPVTIRDGEIANLTIFNPDEEWQVDKNLFKSKSNNTPFHGYRLKGKPKYAVNNGQFFESVL